MSLNALLGLPEDSSDEDEKPVIPIRRTVKEEEVFVDITPQKAIEEEITYQRIQCNYTTESQLKERKDILLKFLQGSQEYMKKKGTKDLWAARSFIEYQVNELFHGSDNFSSEEKDWFEETSDSVVRILHRIQCRKYLLDKGLAVSSSIVASYFINARTKANQARYDKINRENDRMLANRVRQQLLARFTRSVNITDEPQEKKINIDNESMAVETEDDSSYMDDVDALIGSMEKQTIAPRHCEFSDNTEFDEICDELLRQLVRTRIADDSQEEEQDCVMLSSPPRSPVESRPASPEQGEEDKMEEYPDYEEEGIGEEVEQNEHVDKQEEQVVAVKGILRKRTKYGSVIPVVRNTPKNTRLQFCDPRENRIRLFTRASEEETQFDHIWTKQNIARKRVMNDNGTTIWHETYDGKTGSKYLSTYTSRTRGRGSTQPPKSCIMGEQLGGKEMLPTTFCLPNERTYPVKLNAIAELEIPTYVGMQPRIGYYQTKSTNAFNDYFTNDVFSRLCNFHYELLGCKSLREYKSRQGKQQFYYNAQPQYNKLMLTDSIFGQCNPMTLLNTCLLVCNPHVDHKMFVNSIFEFIRKLLAVDLSTRRKQELDLEFQEELPHTQLEYLDPSFYSNQFDFDVSGGIFLCFGHDLLIHNKELGAKNKKEMSKNKEIMDKMERIRRGRVDYEVQMEALAETVVLTNKVIFELKELWTLMDWWSWRPFPDIWLITLPEGRNGEFINVYNMLLRDVVASKEMFPVTVKLIDWTEVLENANANGEHDKNAVDEDSVEDRFKYLFRLMRQKADVRYRRSHEERSWDGDLPRNYKDYKDYRDRVI